MEVSSKIDILQWKLQQSKWYSSFYPRKKKDVPLGFLLYSFQKFLPYPIFLTLFFFFLIVLFVILFPVADREWETEDEETWGAEQECRIHKLRFTILMGGFACESVLD